MMRYLHARPGRESYGRLSRTLQFHSVATLMIRTADRATYGRYNRFGSPLRLDGVD